MRVDGRGAAVVRAGRAAGAVVAASLSLGVAAVSAAPVQQFAIQLKDVTPDGRYAVVYTSNAFDTTGDPPPALSGATLRLARGMSIKPGFLKPDRLCDVAQLARYLMLKRPKGATFGQAVGAFPGGSARIEGQLPRSKRPVVSTCRSTFLGRGTAVIDARQPGLAAPIPSDFSPSAPLPAKFSLFLSRPTAAGAIAGIGVLAHYDTAAPNVARQPWYGLLQRAFTLNVFDDPTPDGRYGYRVDLPTERTIGVRFSIAELRVESRGLTGSTARGPREFWATPPRCPASGQLAFRADYRYATGLAGSSVVQVPCPRFRP